MIINFDKLLSKFMSINELEAKKKILNAWDKYIDNKIFWKNIAKDFINNVNIKLSYVDEKNKIKDNYSEMTHYWETDGDLWVPNNLYYELTKCLGVERILGMNNFNLAVSMTYLHFYKFNKNYSSIRLFNLLPKKYKKSCKLIIPYIL